MKCTNAFLVFFSLCLLPFFSFAQLNDSLMINFYNKTLIYYFSDTTTNKDMLKYGSILVKADIDTGALVKSVGKNRFKFCTDQSEVKNILSLPYQKNQGRTVYVMSDKTIGLDSLDVNIDGYTIIEAGENAITLRKWARGETYIPDMRFMYDKNAAAWMFISGEEISNQKMEEMRK